MVKAAVVAGTPKVTLELSMEEAETLIFVDGFIGGGNSGPRQHIHSIADALTAAGVVRACHHVQEGHSSLYINYDD